MPSARKLTFMLSSCTSRFNNYLCMCSNLKHFAASLLLMQHSHCGAERQTVCVGLMLTFDTETTALWLEQWQFQSVQSLLQHQHRLFPHNCTDEWGGGLFLHIQMLQGTPFGTCKLTKWVGIKTKIHLSWLNNNVFVNLRKSVLLNYSKLLNDVCKLSQ